MDCSRAEPDFYRLYANTNYYHFTQKCIIQVEFIAEVAQNVVGNSCVVVTAYVDISEKFVTVNLCMFCGLCLYLRSVYLASVRLASVKVAIVMTRLQQPLVKLASGNKNLLTTSGFDLTCVM
jgi:hypothetical protein